jgi:CRISPR-associated protein Csx17
VTVHSFPGLRAGSLLTYMAGLGLTRVVAEQADSRVRTWWSGDVLHMDTALGDVGSFLVDEYHPVPAFSPWNGGSGFGDKDKTSRVALEKLAGVDADRLEAFTKSYRIVGDVLARVRDVPEKEHKQRLVIELRNRLPEEALTWLDAVVVDGGDRLLFPGVYGTGGNDGRLEFSSNFHQRLFNVLPELGAKRAESMAWVSDALSGAAQHPLKVAPAGQFDLQGASSPGTWALSSGDKTLVNPWLYVLMVEACGYLAATLTRAAGRGPFGASVPFTVAAAAVGPTAGSDTEEARGEFWAPMWTTALAHAELRQMFEQARATWAGRTVSSSAGMYAAVKSHGVDSRISAFVRYGLLKRNGLAFSAVLRDRVEVTTRPGIDIAIGVEDRMRGFTRGTSGRAKAQTRRLHDRQMAFVSADDPQVARDHLMDWLAALTEREHAAALSDREVGEITGVPRLPRAQDAVEALRPWLEERAEHRLAASLASAYFYDWVGNPRRRQEMSLRDAVVGSAPQGGKALWTRPVVRGFGARPIEEVLADVAVWREQRPDNDRGAGRGTVLAAGHRYVCRDDDVADWVSGRYDPRRFDHAFAACLALDWRGWRQVYSPGLTGGTQDPAFAAVAAVASGAILLPGFSPDGPLSESRQGLPQGWALRLRSGQLSGVVGDSVALLNRSRIATRVARRGGDGAQGGSARPEGIVRMSVPLIHDLDRERAIRFAAALLMPMSDNPLRRLGLVRAVRAEEHQADATDLTLTPLSPVDPITQGVSS